MRNCPTCDQEKAYFIGGICGDCHAAGKDLDVAGQERRTVAKIKRVECEWCHKPKSNIYEHRKICKLRPEGQPSAPDGRSRAHGRKPRVGKRKYRRRVAQDPGPAGPKAGTSAETNGCPLCRPGPNAALERELVTEAVRVGLSLENAVGFVRRAMAAGHKLK